MSNPTAGLAETRSRSDAGTALVRGRRMISLGMVAVGLLFTVASGQLDRGTLANPGPGLYPILVGVLAMLAGATGLLEIRRGQIGPADDDMVTGHRHWVFLAAMALAVFLLPLLGYFVSAAIGGSVVSWSAGQKIWWKALLTGLMIAVVSSIVFISVLGVYLPGSIIDGMFS